jgi:hypothetical protein
MLECADLSVHVSLIINYTENIYNGIYKYNGIGEDGQNGNLLARASTSYCLYLLPCLEQYRCFRWHP